MADCASHLVDHVLPLAPYRLWTLSLPRRARLAVVSDPEVLSRVLEIFLHAVFAWQRRRARQGGIERPLVGSVTFLQLFGSLLQLTPHGHSFIPEGVFAEGAPGELRFHRLGPPADADVEWILERIAARVLALLEEREGAEDPSDAEAAMACSRIEALQPPLYTIPLTPEELRRPLCAFREGFSLHADLAVRKDDRETLERMLRYGLRPPFARRRLSLTGEGKVRLKLRKPFYTGQTDILFEPVEFLRRLAAPIPKPRQNLVRFHGLFGPNARLRPALSKLLPKAAQQPASNVTLQGVTPDPPAPKPLASDAEAARASAVPVVYRRPWAALLRRVFGHQVLVCPRCQGRMDRIQLVEDPAVIVRILTHLGLPTSLPDLASARAPPQRDLAFEFCDYDLSLP